MASSKDLDIIILCSPDDLRHLAFNLGREGFSLKAGGDKKIYGTIDGVPIDIDRVDNPRHYAAHLLYRTGPANFNIKTRQIAKELGFTLNETFEADSEEEIFTKLGMRFIPPSDRG